MNAPLPLSPLADAHITLPDDALAQEYSNQLALADVSLLPRYGVKGPQAATWLANAGIAIPAAANNWFALPSDGLIARLGVSEFLLEGEFVTNQLRTLHRTDGVYPVIRQDAAFILSGPRVHELLVQVCNVDLRNLANSLNVVLTSMAGVSVTLLAQQRPSGNYYRLWCDGTYGLYVWETLLAITQELGGGAVAAEQLP